MSLEDEMRPSLAEIIDDDGRRARFGFEGEGDRVGGL